MTKQPLADRLRPTTLDDVVGQDHLLDANSVIRSAITSGNPLSMILWGPPGCGKTTIARLYAQAFSMRFRSLNAVFSGIADLKKVVKETEDQPLLYQGTVLFVDEIHRFNKAQQDAFLPYIESGVLVLVGATAENPSFYLNNALLSRTRVLELRSLDTENLDRVLFRYETTCGKLPLTDDGRKQLLSFAQGDGRYLLNMVESLQASTVSEPFDGEALGEFLQRRTALYDRAGDGHYNLISALHKAVRGSDVDGALYWLARILQGGEDPRFLARRLIRMASEDIGLADPQALQVAIAAKDAYEMLGSPEGELALAEVTTYLALAPKSNAIYKAFKSAQQLALETGNCAPPIHSMNAPTQTMKDLGYGKGYIYDHDTPDGYAGESYFPDSVPRSTFYVPVERGFERDLRRRVDYFASRRKA
ncbi:Replication-associated recombination protein A [Chlamydiales bacterium SCGC AG-110-P3]|nr:Replication-associated recombination protein A [Chlamydiales bacterium SCGC AG-110-P3]